MDQYILIDFFIGGARSLSDLGNRKRKMAERGPIVTISPVHSGTMSQETNEIWTAETRLQPIHPKSDRLLECLL